jgi:hypothetical protein
MKPAHSAYIEIETILIELERVDFLMGSHGPWTVTLL